MIDYEKRAMIEAEDKYTFRQSSQISSQTGLIGYLRADMDTDGNGFFSSWNDYRKDLKTDEFKQEFDEVINSLREEGDILHNRKDLAYYCYTNPQSKMPTEQDYYGVRVDTDKYTYLLRLNPNKGEYNKELFRIPDGGKIKIHLAWNEDQVRTCRYIDDYHVEVGDNLYHICEFAERMEQNGHTYEPVRTELPEQCYRILPGSGEIIVVKRNEKGYYNPHIPAASKEQAREIVDEYNGKLGVTRAQEEAMRTGSMFGFHVPGADPKNYDKDGKPLPPKDRGDAR